MPVFVDLMKKSVHAAARIKAILTPSASPPEHRASSAEPGAAAEVLQEPRHASSDWSDAIASFSRPSFSQFGEDQVLWWMFSEQRNGFYVDIGCHHPYNLSNTALLHIKNDWSGINIDLDPRSIALFDQARPADQNIVAALGRESCQMEATFLQESCEQNALGPIKPHLAHILFEKRVVDVVPLTLILERHLPSGQTIDFMNIDAEGFDYDILCSNDWSRFRPKVIAVEVHVHDIDVLVSQPIHKLLVEQGYECITHSVITSIYRRV